MRWSDLWQGYNSRSGVCQRVCPPPTRPTPGAKADPGARALFP